MRVKAINDYYDLVLKKTIVAGTEFEVADARGKALSSGNNAAGIALVQIIEATPPATKKGGRKKDTQ